MRSFLERAGLKHCIDNPDDPLLPSQCLSFERLKTILASQAAAEDMEPASPGVALDPVFIDDGGVCYVRGSNSA